MADSTKDTADTSGTDDVTSAKDSASGKAATAKKAVEGAGAKATKSGPKRTKRNADRAAARSGNPAKRSTARQKATYTSADGQRTIRPNPRWFLPTLIALLLVGLAWLVTFYISGARWPVEAWGNWNLVAGFAFLVGGLVMSTRWR